MLQIVAAGGGELLRHDATNFKDQSFGGKERKWFGTGLNEQMEERWVEIWAFIKQLSLQVKNL